MSLLEQVNKAANKSKEPETDEDVIKRAWEKRGSPRTPEKVYQVLLSLFKGDEDKVIAAFKKIGISFEKHKEAAKVLDPHIEKGVARLTMNMNAKEISDLIQIVRSGKMPG